MLTRVRREKNDFQDANTRLGIELKAVRARLADFVKENKRLRRSIFSKCSNKPLYSSAKKRVNRVMSVGILTGRPEEEMPGFAGDLLQELSQLHEQVRQVMQGIAQALWPSASLPGGMGELVEIKDGNGSGLDRVGQYQSHIHIHEDSLCPCMKISMGEKLCPCPNPLDIHTHWISDPLGPLETYK